MTYEECMVRLLLDKPAFDWKVFWDVLSSVAMIGFTGGLFVVEWKREQRESERKIALAVRNQLRVAIGGSIGGGGRQHAVRALMGLANNQAQLVMDCYQEVYAETRGTESGRQFPSPAKFLGEMREGGVPGWDEVKLGG